MKILGIDPGTKNCGYAILEKSKFKTILLEAGLIKIKPNTLQYQITELCEGLDLIFKNHKFDEVAIEDIFFAYNPKTVLKLAQFRGALSLKILQLHVTGKAKADKEQVAFMVKKILGINKEIKPLDITDAIAIALTHANNLRIN